MTGASERDYEAARAFVRKIVDAQHAMEIQVESLMAEAAGRIVEILYGAGLTAESLDYGRLPLSVQFKITGVLRWLQEAIADYFEQTVTEEGDSDRDMILPFVLGRIHGKTFGERLSEYVARFRTEMLVLTAAGLATGLGSVPLVRSVVRNFRKPYANPELAGAIAEKPSYGRGRTNSMFTAIGDLTKNGVARAFNYQRMLEALKKGAAGFYTFRNSTYPCDTCDEYAAYFHPMDDARPPLHLSCVCGVIYVDWEGVSVFRE